MSDIFFYFCSIIHRLLYILIITFLAIQARFFIFAWLISLPVTHHCNCSRMSWCWHIFFNFKIYSLVDKILCLLEIAWEYFMSISLTTHPGNWFYCTVRVHCEASISFIVLVGSRSSIIHLIDKSCSSLLVFLEHFPYVVKDSRVVNGVYTGDIYI